MKKLPVLLCLCSTFVGFGFLSCASVPKSAQEISPVCVVGIKVNRTIEWYDTVKEEYKGDRGAKKEEAITPELLTLIEDTVYQSLTENGYTIVPKNDVLNVKSYRIAEASGKNSHIVPDGYSYVVAGDPDPQKDYDSMLGNMLFKAKNYREVMVDEFNARSFVYVSVFLSKQAPLKEGAREFLTTYPETPIVPRVSVYVAFDDQDGETIISTASRTSGEPVPYTEKPKNALGKSKLVTAMTDTILYLSVDYDSDLLMNQYPDMIRDSIKKSFDVMFTKK